MSIEFYKYQGAGNDFVIIDDRNGLFDESNFNLINFLCDRRFGIGADGLMLLRSKEGFDFEMVYFNADGHEGSMCGNGGRCIVAFAYHQKIIKEHCVFMAVDGEHEADMIPFDGKTGVSLKMIDVNGVEVDEQFCYLNTGSPHYVQVVDDLKNYDVVSNGKAIRFNERFEKVGTNVNFIELTGKQDLAIRTYERGVEDETLACGTGVTAAVISAYQKRLITSKEVEVKAMGGLLKVVFEEKNGVYKNVWLQGPAEFVFKGVLDV